MMFLITPCACINATPEMENCRHEKEWWLV